MIKCIKYSKEMITPLTVLIMVDDEDLKGMYKCDICGDLRVNPSKSMLHNKRTCYKDLGYQLKLSKENTVNIVQPKESWSREEVIALIFRAYNQYSFDISPQIASDLTKWIEENL